MIVDNMKVVCVKLPKDCLGNVEYVKKNLPNSKTSEIVWIPSTVGIKKENRLDRKLRFSYYCKTNMEISMSEYHKQRIIDIVRKIHPSEIQDELCDDAVCPYLKKGTEIDLLCYLKGGFFKKHVDHSESLDHFATALIFVPTNLTGGDLILSVDKDQVYDPDNMLVFEDGTVRAKVDSFTSPVLITFYVKVFHNVEEVKDGYRLCYKMKQTNQMITDAIEKGLLDNINMESENTIPMDDSELDDYYSETYFYQNITSRTNNDILEDAYCESEESELEDFYEAGLFS